MRRPVSTILALGLVTVLSACGGGATATGSPTGTVATEPPPPSGTTAPAAGGGTSFSGPVTAAETPEDLLATLPAKLCGKEPSRYAFDGPEWAQGAAPDAITALEGAGGKVDDVIAAITITQGGSVCNATLVRMKGLTPDQVLAVAALTGGTAGAKETTVDGRSVREKVTEMLTLYYYAIDDVLLMASALDEASAREVLGALPAP